MVGDGTTAGAPQGGAGEWARTREAARRVLVEAAAAGRTLTYAELVGRVGPLVLAPDAPEVARLLREISTAEHDAGRPLLSAVVVRKGAGVPGHGFFRLAGLLGRAELAPDAPGRHAAWERERARLREVHGAP